MAARKSGSKTGTGSPRKSASKRGGSKTAAETPAASAPVPGDAATINQSPADVEFNKRTSAGAAAAAQPSATTAAGRAAAGINETVPGGRYKGTDGKIRNAHGEVLSDKSDKE